MDDHAAHTWDLGPAGRISLRPADLRRVAPYPAVLIVRIGRETFDGLARSFGTYMSDPSSPTLPPGTRYVLMESVGPPIPGALAMVIEGPSGIRIAWPGWADGGV